jgi:hypothetical protein
MRQDRAEEGLMLLLPVAAVGGSSGLDVNLEGGVA